jgi:hypothetical protein
MPSPHGMRGVKTKIYQMPRFLSSTCRKYFEKKYSLSAVPGAGPLTFLFRRPFGGRGEANLQETNNYVKRKMKKNKKN